MLFKKFRSLKKATLQDEENFVTAMEENKVGFLDKLAMSIAAFVVIILPCFLILLAIGGFALLLLELIS